MQDAQVKKSLICFQYLSGCQVPICRVVRINHLINDIPKKLLKEWKHARFWCNFFVHFRQMFRLLLQYLLNNQILAFSEECVPNNKLSYFSTKTYIVGTQKNRLNETFLLSAQNIC